METLHTYESSALEVININLATQALPKVFGVEYGAQQQFLDDPDQAYLVTITEIPVESSGPEIHTPQNPYGILETIGGGLQRMANMEAAIPATIEQEPSVFLQRLATSNASSLNMASIESGVLPTYGEFGSIIIMAVRGKLTTDSIDWEQGVLRFPSEPIVHTVDPQTRQHTEATLDATPFSAHDMRITVDDEKATYPDRAVSVLYDTKTDMTLIGISRGIAFDQRDVKKTIDERRAHPNDPAFDRRVAENMKTRLQKENLIDEAGYYERIEEGVLVRRLFDVQNPQEYIDPNFSRKWQIAELEEELFDAVKQVRREAQENSAA